MCVCVQVVFEGEEGVDAGGVTKEFFQLLSQALFDPSFGAFPLLLCFLLPWLLVVGTLASLKSLLRESLCVSLCVCMCVCFCV